MSMLSAQRGGGAAIFVVFVIVAIGIFVFSAAAAKKRRDAYVRLAQRLGMQVDFADVVGLESSGFGLFDDGHSRKVLALLREPDERAAAGLVRCAFEYQYTTGSGKNQQVHCFVGAMSNIPATVPRLNIGREVFGGKLLSALGMSDIELESGEFNAAFRVAGADEKAAFAVLDGRLQEWLHTHADDPWSNIELLGRCVLIVHRGRNMEVIPGLLEFAQQFRDLIPEVVSDMYPVPGGSPAAGSDPASESAAPTAPLPPTDIPEPGAPA